MKPISLALMLLLLFSCKKEDDNRAANVHCDESLLPKDQLYLAAVKLEMFDPANPDKDLPYFSISRVEEKYAALKAIEKLQNPYTDSVFKRYGIPTEFYGKGDAQYIAITAPEDRNLSNAIINGTVTQKSLRDVYEKYNIQFVKEDNGWGNSYLIVKTCGLVNTSAVAKEVQNASVAATPVQNTVTYQKRWQDRPTNISVSANLINNTTEYDFSVGHGLSSSSGFQFHRHWVFSVDKNGNAAFVKSYGDPAPPL